MINAKCDDHLFVQVNITSFDVNCAIVWGSLTIRFFLKFKTVNKY